jgi:copper transport protein
LKAVVRTLMMLSAVFLAAGFVSSAPLYAAANGAGIAGSGLVVAGESVPRDVRGHGQGIAAGQTVLRGGLVHGYGIAVKESALNDDHVQEHVSTAWESALNDRHVRGHGIAAEMPTSHDGHGHGTDDSAPHGGHAPEAGTNDAGRYSVQEFFSSLGLDEGLHIAFFILFMPLIGVVLWWVLSRGWTEMLKRHVGRHILQLQRLTFLAVTANVLRMVWLNGGFDDLSAFRAMAGDPEGLAWFVLFALSAIGLLTLQRNRFVDMLWLLLGIAATTQIGHAEMSLDHVLSSIFSGIHMLAGALWIGGLYVLLALRRRFRHDAERLAPNVANASIAAMVLLFVSGLVNSAMYLPDLSLIVHTRWGWMLVGKTILFALMVLLVIISRRRQRNRMPGLLRLQFLIVVILAAVSGILPISEPVPDEGPLHWHVMGEDVHMTGEIDPLTIGDNEYRVTVWFPEGTGEPRSVELELRPDDGNAEVHTVVLERREAGTDLVFVGFADYHYAATGRHIDRPGRWTVVVNIVDASGKVWTFENTATVY